MDYIPYTYIVKNKSTGLFYYGVKISKLDANPKLFWQRYFTSSRLVKQLIEQYGIDDFDWEIRKTFTTAEDAVRWEKRVLRKLMHNNKCLNQHCGGNIVHCNKPRIIPDKNGINSYHKAVPKTKDSRLKKVHSSGLNDYQVAYQKAIDNDPQLCKFRSEQVRKVRSKIGKDGLNSYQRAGKQLSGDNNPAKRPEVRAKISKANKGNIRTDEAIERTLETRRRKGLDKKHSKRMTADGNPCYNTIWINNNTEEKRINAGSIIPEGYTLGRISLVCPHCGKEGKGPNMKRYHYDNCKSLKDDR